MNKYYLVVLFYYNNEIKTSIYSKFVLLLYVKEGEYRMDIDEILLNTEEKMENSISSLENKFTTVRAGRANPAMLDGIMVEYYGTPTPLKQLANISIPEARQLSIKPFDRSALGSIEKAIFEANLGVTPNNNGESIFITIPPLTEERRKELVKTVKKYSEEAKVQIRNIRRDAMEDFKKKQKASEITEDDLKGIEKDIQNLTDKFVKEIEDITAAKEKEILTV